METLVSREHALRFTFMAISGLLFIGANAAWIGLGYLNPLAWVLEWSSVVLSFLCIYLALRTKEFKRYTRGYLLITVSLAISIVSYYPSIIAPSVQGSITQTINPAYFLVFLIPIFLVPFLIYYDQKNMRDKKMLPFLFFISLIGSIGFLLFMFYRIGSSFPTDESVFDMYAAHLFLQGKNPYDPALMANAFKFYHFKFQAFDPITPLSTGGYVNMLTYPALSFLVFIPAVSLHLKASAIMLLVLLVPIIIVWRRTWSHGNWIKSSYALLPFITLMLYAYQGASADTDALWAVILMLSYSILPKFKASGLFFGLALSVKQLPILVAPFFIYFLYREYGSKKMGIWILFAAVSFFGINGFFIALNPDFWFSSMFANEFAPLIGIGFGIPQVSFSGWLNTPRIFYTITMIDLLIVLFMAYVLKYNEMKYTLFAFPILIFLFNYRLFPQYLYYWMIISILPMLDKMQNNKKPLEKKTETIFNEVKNRKGKRKAILALIVSFLLASVALAYHEGIQKNPGSFTISDVSITGLNSTGFVNRMNITLSFHGESNLTHIYFRIFNDGPFINGNMFKWVEQGSVLLESGYQYTLTIVPQYQAYSVNPKEGFMVVAYYGNIQGSHYVNRAVLD